MTGLPSNGTLTVLAVADGNEFKILISNFLCPQCGNTSDYNISIVLENLRLYYESVVLFRSVNSAREFPAFHPTQAEVVRFDFNIDLVIEVIMLEQH